jgi:hypothetical protein
MHRRPACWAEVEGQAIAAVRDARILRGISPGRYTIPAEAGLDAENTARSPLTFQAMAGGDANRLALTSDTQLSAIAGGASGNHLL